jgi:hypothetical protein
VKSVSVKYLNFSLLLLSRDFPQKKESESKPTKLFIDVYKAQPICSKASNAMEKRERRKQ